MDMKKNYYKIMFMETDLPEIKKSIILEILLNQKEIEILSGCNKYFGQSVVQEDINNQEEISSLLTKNLIECLFVTSEARIQLPKYRLTFPFGRNVAEELEKQNDIKK